MSPLVDEIDGIKLESHHYRMFADYIVSQEVLSGRKPVKAELEKYLRDLNEGKTR